MPFWFWGALCAGFSALVLLAGFWLYVKPGRAARTTTLAAAA
jgi:hypothetical protein